MQATTPDYPATPFREAAEVEAWRSHDPVLLLERELRGRGLLDDAGVTKVADEAEELAAGMRDRLGRDPELDPMDLFAHVYEEKTGQLRAQAEQLRAELEAEAEGEGEAR
jgi:pyruvate dehydrogenase E1 component alpha subunit